MAQSNITYSAYRVETYKKGEKRRRYSFDSRKEGSYNTARDFANNKYLAGYKVTFYKLDKVVDAEGVGKWNRTEYGTADGRKTVAAVAAMPKKTAKVAKKPTKTETAKERFVDQIRPSCVLSKEYRSLVDDYEGLLKDMLEDLMREYCVPDAYGVYNFQDTILTVEEFKAFRKRFEERFDKVEKFLKKNGFIEKAIKGLRGEK